MTDPDLKPTPTGAAFWIFASICGLAGVSLFGVFLWAIVRVVLKFT